MNKKKLLIFIDWYYPAFKAGGPIKSVHNIASALKEEMDISIVTSAYDLDGVALLENVEPNTWIERDGVQVIYLDKNHQQKSFIKQCIKVVSPDIVYFNSLFSRSFTLTPLLLSKKLGIKKIILAPRGMLGKAALEIKPLKKRLFISISRIFGLFNDIIWHASSELEKQEIEWLFGKASTIVIAQNISGVVSERLISTDFKQKGELKLIFFSRINSKKNLKLAIEVLVGLNQAGISLDIYGPVEDDEYWEECKILMNSSTVAINYKGLIHPENLINTLQQYHFLLFPTKHENYGHVITESLCAGLPVIISEHTPWRNLEKSNVGYDLPLTLDAFFSVLAELVEEENSTYNLKVAAASNYSKTYIVHSSIIEQNRKLFQE